MQAIWPRRAALRIRRNSAGLVRSPSGPSAISKAQALKPRLRAALATPFAPAKASTTNAPDWRYRRLKREAVAARCPSKEPGSPPSRTPSSKREPRSRETAKHRLLGRSCRTSLLTTSASTFLFFSPRPVVFRLWLCRCWRRSGALSTAGLELGASCTTC